MGGKKDQIKGRIKEAAGALADDDRLKREGKRRGDRIARPAMLVLLPSLCDLNEPTTGRREAHAR